MKKQTPHLIATFFAQQDVQQWYDKYLLKLNWYQTDLSPVYTSCECHAIRMLTSQGCFRSECFTGVVEHRSTITRCEFVLHSDEV